MPGIGVQREKMTVWRALATNPLRFLFSSWPWRSLGYLIAGVPLGLIWVVVATALLALGTLLTPVGIGFGLLACIPLSAVAMGVLERHRLRWLDPRPTPSPHGEPLRPGLRPWVRIRLREAATWRELGYAILHAVLAVADGAIVLCFAVGVVYQVGAPAIVRDGERIQYGSLATIDTPDKAWKLVPIGVVTGLIGVYLMTIMAAAQAALAHTLLVRPAAAELGARLSEVTASRARMVSAFEAERRRIERDLHDGAQQRLTGLIMTLGLARLDGSRELIAKAHSEARAALDDLRDLVRGIYPSILTDRGLKAAVESVAERSSIPIGVDIELPGRPPEAIESAAYFSIAEALANVAKHSGASRARVYVRQLGRLLVVEVRDNGVGGVDPAKGSGLRGLADRVAAHDGAVRLSSPAGGPTIIRVEIPCPP
jgi:signal transduction histidine kinase